MTDNPSPPLIVGDQAIAKIAAQVAADVPGVVRLAPTLAKIIKKTIARAARTITSQPDPEPSADPGGIVIDRDNPGITTITARIIVDCSIPALATVGAVQLAIKAAVQKLESVPVDVTVIVVDAEFV